MTVPFWPLRISFTKDFSLLDNSIASVAIFMGAVLFLHEGTSSIASQIATLLLNSMSRARRFVMTTAEFCRHFLTKSFVDTFLLWFSPKKKDGLSLF